MFYYQETKRRIRNAHLPNVMSRIKSIFRPESKIIPTTDVLSSSSASAHSADDSSPVSPTTDSSTTSPPSLDLSPTVSSTNPSPAMSGGFFATRASVSTASPKLPPPPPPATFNKGVLTPPASPKASSSTFLPDDHTSQVGVIVAQPPTPASIQDPIPLPTSSTASSSPAMSTLELFTQCSQLLRKEAAEMLMIQRRLEARLKIQDEVANLQREVRHLRVAGMPPLPLPEKRRGFTTISTIPPPEDVD